MAEKPEKSVTAPNYEGYPRKSVECEDGSTGEERGRKYARLMTSPELAALRVIRGAEQNSGVEEKMDVPTLVETLRDQAKAVNLNDLSKAEAMLISQATALESLFARLTEKAFSVTHLPQFDSFMRLALRAQNQCRATLETLAAIKNPPVVFAKQANIAHGPQQVNNGTASPATPARAGENKILQNELLLEAKDGTTLDTRATGSAIGTDSAMETVGKIHRAKYKGG